MRWNDETNVKFVELYTQLRCLWDPSDALYKNKAGRRAAHARMAAEMNIQNLGVAEVRAKIKAFRGTFNLEQAKQQKSAEYTPTLKWYNLMKRAMITTDTKRWTARPFSPEASDNTSGTSFVDQDPLECSETFVSYAEEQRADNLEENTSPVEELPEVRAAVVATQHEVLTQRTKRSVNRLSKTPRISSSAREMKALKKSVFNKRAKSNKNTEDEFDIFGKNVAAQLKALSPYQAITAEMEINYILSKCRFADLCGASSSHEELLAVSMPDPVIHSSLPHEPVFNVPEEQPFASVNIKTEVNH